MSARTDGHERLTDQPLPDLLSPQVAGFTLDTLRAKPVRTFDPQATLDRLRSSDERAVIAVDIGGDKLVACSYEVRDGNVSQGTELIVIRGTGGAEYLRALEKVASLARSNALPVGISFAGPTDDTKVLASPNLPILAIGLRDRYGNNFANLFPAVAVANDAEAGIMAGSVQAVSRSLDTRYVIYVINGSGLGGALLKEKMIFATEPGHVEIDPKLNPLHQRKPCGLLGSSHVCVETVAASKAGIEDLWFQLRKERLSGKEIAARYLSGDSLARDLYGNSALIIAHVIKGIARAFGLPPDFSKTAIVGHGGIFEIADYRDRVTSILEKDLSAPPRILFTRDFSSNACLDGAAIAAAILPRHRLAKG